MLREGKSFFLVGLLVLAVLGILTLGPVPTYTTPDSTETLRPNAVGTYQEWDLSDTTHYGATSDESDSTYIYTGVDEERDIQAFADSTFPESVTINWITVNIRLWSTGSGKGEKVAYMLRSGGADWESSGFTISNARGQWYDYASDQLTEDPTDSQSWTKTKIDALEAGLRLKEIGSGEEVRCAEIWVTVDYTVPPDTTPPTWSNAGTNNTFAGQPTLFHVKWTDNVGLSGFIFGTNNTGTWANDTWTPMSGTTDWSNVTKTLNSTPGVVVQWRVWANDTSNNWNDTGILTLTTSQPTVALHPSTVSWTLGSEPATSPYFNLTVDVTDITNCTAVTFSIHWDPTILNLTAVTKGDCLENGNVTQFLYVVNYTAGNLSDCVYAQITPIVPKTFPPTTWGLVATLTFEFIGTSPTADSPIDTDIIFVNEPPRRPTYWAAWPGPVSHNFTQMLPCHFHYGAPPVVGYNLNLRVMDWDLTDSIPGAYVYKNSDVKISDANGWANWTGVNGTVQIKVKWYGFWVNGTSITVDSNKTIDLHCNIFDIEVTCVEELQNATLQYVNVTVYNASVAGNMIRTGITGPDGKVSLANVPNATLTFICYDGASPQHVIANVTRTITTEDQAETITCTQNYISTTHTWGIIGSYSSALCLGFILLLGFAAGKPSRMLNCLKERIKKVRSKQNKRKGGRKNT